MLDDNDAKIAKALKLGHDTVEEARRQLDRIAEEAEGLGLDLSDEIAAATDDLMLSMQRFVDAVRDGLDFLEAGEHVAGRMPEQGDGDEDGHAVH
jgi:hypothetical protein